MSLSKGSTAIKKDADEMGHPSSAHQKAVQSRHGGRHRFQAKTAGGPADRQGHGQRCHPGQGDGILTWSGVRPKFFFKQNFIFRSIRSVSFTYSTMRLSLFFYVQPAGGYGSFSPVPCPGKKRFYPSGRRSGLFLTGETTALFQSGSRHGI